MGFVPKLPQLLCFVPEIVLLGRSEVDQHRLRRASGDVVLPTYKNVFGLDIPVKNARPMDHGQCCEQRSHDSEQVFLGEWLPLFFPAT